MGHSLWALFMALRAKRDNAAIDLLLPDAHGVYHMTTDVYIRTLPAVEDSLSRGRKSDGEAVMRTYLMMA